MAYIPQASRARSAARFGLILLLLSFYDVSDFRHLKARVPVTRDILLSTVDPEGTLRA